MKANCLFNYVLGFSFFFILFSNSTNAQNVVINSYYNGLTPNEEWIELLVIQDNTSLMGSSVRDYDAVLNQWNSAITFDNSDHFWENLRSGTVITIYLRSTDNLGNERAIDVNKSDGYIQLYATNPQYFSGDLVSNPLLTHILNIEEGTDILELLDEGNSTVHALGHGVSGITDWDNLLGSKLAIGSGISVSSEIVVCPGASIDDYSSGIDPDKIAVNTSDFSFGLPNVCTSSMDDNREFWRVKREPKWNDAFLTIYKSRFGNGQTLKWNAAEDTNPNDTTQGYVIIRSLDNVNVEPEDGHAYLIGELIGTSSVIAVIKGSENTTYTDNLPVPNGAVAYYRVYAYRFDSDQLNGSGYHIARGTAYNQLNYCQNVWCGQLANNRVDTGSYKAEMDTLFEHLDKTQIPSQILYDRIFPLAYLHEFNGSASNTISSNAEHFFQSVYELSEASYKCLNVKNSSEFRMNLINNYDENYYPIGILLFDFHILDTLSVVNNLIYIQNEQLYDVVERTASPYLKKQAFVSSALGMAADLGTCRFKLDKNFYLTNKAPEIISFQIDFADGNGLQTYYWDNVAVIDYTSSGEKTVKVIAKTKDNQTYTTFFNIIIRDAIPVNLPVADPCIDVLSITGLPFNGSQYGEFVPVEKQMAKGKAYFYYADCVTKVVRKPIIFLDGFDPTNSRDHVKIYDEYIQDNDKSGLHLGTKFRNEGYDIIILDFDDGGDFVERNANVVIQALTEIYELHKNTIEEDFVVIGPSMGALIGKYALAYAESQGIPHHTRLYISFDGPHQGANFSIGVQEVIPYVFRSKILEPSDSKCDEAGAKPLTEANFPLNCNAAQQMLVHHYLGGSEVPRGSRFRSTFVENDHLIGYPKLCRNIALINGSKDADNQSGIDPCAEAMKFRVTLHTGASSGSDLIRWKMFNSAQNNRCYSLDAYTWKPLAKKFGLEKNHEQFSQPAPGQFSYDKVPGSMSTIINKIIVDGNKAIDTVFLDYHTAFCIGIPHPYIHTTPTFGAGIEIIPLIVKYRIPKRYRDNIHLTAPTSLPCFIPTTSAVDLSSGGLVYNFANEDLVCTGKTPFDAIYAPMTNQEHVEITSENALWFEQEIKGNLKSDLNNLTYNFGRNTINAIYKNTTVSNNGIIYINKNVSTAYLNEPNPDLNTMFNVNVGNCKRNVVLTIGNNGKLELGDQTYFNEFIGTVTIKSGSELRLLAGSHLKIHTNSRLIIEEGAKLYFEDGAEINLNGTNAYIEFKGDLEIAALTNFTFIGTGYIKFNQSGFPTQNITYGANSSIKLQGSGSSDKVLEVIQESLYTEGANLFEVKNGTIQLGSNARLNIGGPLTFSNVIVDKTPTYIGLAPRGLYVYGQNGISITNTTFKNCVYGLHAELFFGGVPMNLSGLNFIDNAVGVYAQGKGLSLNNMYFNNNSTSVQGVGMEFSSNITNSTVDLDDDGINYTGGPQSMLRINNSIISTGYNGIQLNQAQLSMICVNVAGDDVGLKISNNGIAHLSPSYGTQSGHNNITSYFLPISLESAQFLHLNYGQNDLIDIVDGASTYQKVISGNFNNTQSVLYAKRNKWHGSECPTSGCDNNLIKNRDYYIVTPSSGPKSIPIEYLPLKGTSSINCFAPQIADPCEIPGSCLPDYLDPLLPKIDPLDYCPSCPPVVTDGVNQKLNYAVKTVLNTLRNAPGPVNDIIAFNKLYEILTFPIPAINPDIEYLKKLAYDAYMQAFGKIVETIYQNNQYQSSNGAEPYVSKVLAIQNANIQMATLSQDKTNLFYYTLDKAQTYRLVGDRELALQFFDAAISIADQDKMAYAEAWRCLTYGEHMVLTGQISKDESESVFAACNFTPASSRMAGSPGSEELLQTFESNGYEFSFSFVPNPAVNTATLSFKLDKNDKVDYEITDVTGKIIYRSLNNLCAAGVNNLSINLNQIDPGLYLIKLIHNGNAYTKRLTVIK